FLYHFVGHVQKVHPLEPFGAQDALYARVGRFCADLDCGLPACLGGLSFPNDAVLDSGGKWIEGITTLWGNISRPESPSGRTVAGLVEDLVELHPVRVVQRDVVYRILQVSVASSNRQPDRFGLGTALRQSSLPVR